MPQFRGPEISSESNMRLLIICIAMLFLSFMQKEEPLCEQKNLRDQCPFPVGTAINTEKLKNEKNYWKLVPQFNSITTEKVMKPEFLQPRKGVYDFSEVDQLVNFCREQKMRLHGHTLIWHKANPGWLEKFKGSAEEWDQLMKDHIQTIIRHCKHHVKSWDVVNEAFNDDGTLRKNIWLKNIGESYIEKAFKYAAEADPEAKLFYNDYSLENYGEKFRAVIKYFKELKEKGVKVDGIGMQMHVTIDFPYISDINQATVHLQEQGFLVHYSELDVSCSTGHNFLASKKALMRQQRNRYESIVKSFMQLKPEYRFGITLWGVSDNDSWLSERSMRARPLLFDNNYRAKPAYCGFIDGAKKSL